MKLPPHRGLSVREECPVEPSRSRDGFVPHRGDRKGQFSRQDARRHRMVSGAGHDAMILAEKVPAAMIFLRTPGGISHDPAESVAVEDVEKSDRVRAPSSRSACFFARILHKDQNVH